MITSHTCTTCGAPLHATTFNGQPTNIDTHPHPDGTHISAGRNTITRPDPIPATEAFRYRLHRCPQKATNA